MVGIILLSFNTDTCLCISPDRTYIPSTASDVVHVFWCLILLQELNFLLWITDFIVFSDTFYNTLDSGLMQKLSIQFTVAMCRNNILFRTSKKKQAKTLSFTYTLDKAMVSMTGDFSNLSSHKEVIQFQYSAAHKLWPEKLSNIVYIQITQDIHLHSNILN